MAKETLYNNQGMQTMFLHDLHPLYNLEILSRWNRDFTSSDTVRISAAKLCQHFRPLAGTQNNISNTSEVYFQSCEHNLVTLQLGFRSEGINI